MLLAAVFPAAIVAVFRTVRIATDQSNKPVIVCDREVPRRAYIFEVAIKTTL
jgi:hypothetical protein